VAGDDLTFVEKIRGKRTRDINLPNESGKVDSRLEPYQPGALGKQLTKAGEGIKALQKKGLVGTRSQGGKR
jgi:hypothetical protein